MRRLTRKAVSANLALLRFLIGRLTPGDRSWLAGQIMRDRFSRDTRCLADFAIKATLVWKNKQYDIAKNGEAAILARLEPFEPETIIDVGANVGDWALHACRTFPRGVVHAFEIADTTAAELRQRTAAFDRIIVNQIGLGDAERKIAIYVSPESNTATSTSLEIVRLGAADHRIYNIETRSARVITGDSYLDMNRIAHVDFLKIDVEGAELDVLKGFVNTLSRNAIEVIQFEYGPLNLSNRVFLRDFHEFLEDRGFELGKVYPEGVAFKKYEFNDEDFVGSNYVACRRDRRDLLDALVCPPLTPA